MFSWAMHSASNPDNLTAGPQGLASVLPFLMTVSTATTRNQKISDKYHPTHPGAFPPHMGRRAQRWEWGCHHCVSGWHGVHQPDLPSREDMLSSSECCQQLGLSGTASAAESPSWGHATPQDVPDPMTNSEGCRKSRHVGPIPPMSQASCRASEVCWACCWVYVDAPLLPLFHPASCSTLHRCQPHGHSLMIVLPLCLRACFPGDPIGDNINSILLPLTLSPL